MAKRLTIVDIAKMSGYSKSTVSRVLRAQANVSDEARERIESIARQTRFTKNAVASSMVEGSQRILMIIVGDISNYFYSAAVKEIEKRMYEKGYLVVVCTSEYDADKELSYLKMARMFRLAGVVLMTAIESDALRQLINDTDCPVLLMNRYISGVYRDTLVQDNFRCAYLATEHLIQMGHRRILHISSGTKASTSVERHAGYMEAMRTYGVRVEEDLVLFGNLTWDSGTALAERIIAENKDYTAAFVDNDMMTVGFVQKWLACERLVPEHISVICFDPSPYLDRLSVGISTVGHSAPEIAARAAEILMKRLEEPDCPVQRVVLEPLIQLRSSTRKLA